MFIFNIAKGRFIELHRRVVANDPANSALIVVLLKTAASDATLKDFDTLAAILAGGSTEADFTNYGRKVLTNADLSNPTVEDGADRVVAFIPDQTWSAAWGVTNNSIVKAIICYDPDTTAGLDNTRLVPVSCSDWAITTNGGSITLTDDATDGYAYAGE